MRWAIATACLSSVAAAAPALAHHSIAAMYDRDKEVEVQGVLSRMELQNPHSMMEVRVRERDGGETVWKLESRGAQGMARMGFGADAVPVGEFVRVKGSPARQGERQMWLNSLTTGSGKSFDFSFRQRR